MSTETITKCDLCRALIHPGLRFYILEFRVVPMVAQGNGKRMTDGSLSAAGGSTSAQGEYCSVSCVHQAVNKVMDTAAERRIAELSADAPWLNEETRA